MREHGGAHGTFCSAHARTFRSAPGSWSSAPTVTTSASAMRRSDGVAPASATTARARAPKGSREQATRSLRCVDGAAADEHHDAGERKRGRDHAGELDEVALAAARVLEPRERVEELLARRGGQRPALHAHLDALRIAQRPEAERSGGGDRQFELFRRCGSRPDAATGRSRSATGGSPRTDGPSRCPCGRWTSSARGAGRRRAGTRAARGTTRRRATGRSREGLRGREGSPSDCPSNSTVRGWTKRSIGSSPRWTRSKRPSGSPRTTLTGPTFDDAAAVGGDGEELLGRGAGRQAADREHAATGADRAAPRATAGWRGGRCSRESALRRRVRRRRRGCG